MNQITCEMTDKEIEVIIKPIFTKMFKANLSACNYGIECYKKGMEYQGIKELAIENDNLIKRIAKLEAQIEKMKCCQNCKYFDWNPMDCIHETPCVEEFLEKWEVSE